tara:strand:- start:654 stop:767 length:114 start_codon:yes stop_codon:yes gene_type:complete
VVVAVRQEAEVKEEELEELVVIENLQELLQALILQVH